VSTSVLFTYSKTVFYSLSFKPRQTSQSKRFSFIFLVLKNDLLREIDKILIKKKSIMNIPETVPEKLG